MPSQRHVGRARRMLQCWAEAGCKLGVKQAQQGSQLAKQLVLLPMPPSLADIFEDHCCCLQKGRGQLLGGWHAAAGEQGHQHSPPPELGRFRILAGYKGLVLGLWLLLLLLLLALLLTLLACC
jgi:hypothetical protein